MQSLGSNDVAVGTTVDAEVDMDQSIATGIVDNSVELIAVLQVRR